MFRILLHRILRLQSVQGFSHRWYTASCSSLLRRRCLTSGSGFLDVDCREYTFFLKLAVKNKLHIAGSLEFLVDHIIHLASGVNTVLVARMVRLPPSRMLRAAPKKSLRHMKSSPDQDLRKGFFRLAARPEIIGSCASLCDGIQKDRQHPALCSTRRRARSTTISDTRL